MFSLLLLKYKFRIIKGEVMEKKREKTFPELWGLIFYQYVFLISPHLALAKLENYLWLSLQLLLFQNVG